MLNEERLANYARQRGLPDRLTGPEARRIAHKERSRKTHAHALLVDADGKKIPCSICKPAKRIPVPVKPAPGPRDWAPAADA